MPMQRSLRFSATAHPSHFLLGLPVLASALTQRWVSAGVLQGGEFQ